MNQLNRQGFPFKQIEVATKKMYPLEVSEYPVPNNGNLGLQPHLQSFCDFQFESAPTFDQDMTVT